MRDYELTSLSIWGDRSRASEQFRGLMDALLPFGDDPADIQEQVEKHLLFLGLSAQAIDSIRRLLIVQGGGDQGFTPCSDSRRFNSPVVLFSPRPFLLATYAFSGPRLVKLK